MYGEDGIVKKKENGSMTVEASICLPVFLFAMILIGYLGQMIRCQDEVVCAFAGGKRSRRRVWHVKK